MEDNSFYFTGLWNLISIGDQAFEKSEDPIYVLENNIPIDPQYYLENQISKVRLVYCSLYSSYVLVFCLDYMLTVGFTLQPLLRIFEPILKNASKELLQGSHTRSISISTPSTGGIMKFAKKQLTCIGCKTLLRYVRIALLFAFSISFLLFIPPISSAWIILCRWAFFYWHFNLKHISIRTISKCLGCLAGDLRALLVYIIS